jgi:mono/diheme cytochrome c family protein
MSLAIVLTVLACGGGEKQNETDNTAPPAVVESQPQASDDPLDNKGVGPVSSVELGPVDQAMVDEGKALYDQLCIACHKPTEKFIGPAPAGILSRRSPEWIMNMILNPDQMVKEDPIAKALLVEYNNIPMIGQGLTEEQARKILEYFRTLE